MYHPDIWIDAAGQTFFTLGIGFGALLAYASYMPIENNCIVDAYCVVIANLVASIFAGMTIFAILGDRLLETGKSAIEVQYNVDFCITF